MRTAYKKLVNCTNVMKLKILESIYLKLDANGRISLEGHNPHLRFPGNKNKIIKSTERTENAT
jgi:hypothetical protein